MNTNKEPVTPALFLKTSIPQKNPLEKDTSPNKIKKNDDYFNI